MCNLLFGCVCVNSFNEMGPSISLLRHLSMSECIPRDMWVLWHSNFMGSIKWISSSRNNVCKPKWAIPHHPKGSKKDKLLMGYKCTFILLSGKLIKEIGWGLQHVNLNVLTRKEQQTKEKGGKTSDLQFIAMALH